MVAAMWPASDRPSPPPPAGRAVPSLGPFAELLGQPYQRLKVAVLRQLAGLPEPSWSLAEAGQALTWLEPATANRLLSELRTDGLVVEVDRYRQPGGPPAWRLSDEGHLVATVCAVLAAPAIAPERAVKVLAAAMALAGAAGVGEPATFAPFVAATAVLERDLAALHRLIDQGDDAALAAAAEVADVHLADLAEMARQVARPGGHETERELAAAVAGRLRTLIDEILGGEARPAPATELRELVAATDPAALAGLVASRLQLPPAVAPVRATAALAALDAHLDRRARSPGRAGRPAPGGHRPHRGAAGGGHLNATELCRVLLVGSVAAADVPELGEPETRDEVRRRLGEAGCELVYSPASERWLARLDGPVPELEGHDPVLSLGTAELAVLATCWLHLRFLPGEGAVQPPSSGEAWVDPDDLAELLGASLNGTGLPSVLERLARAGYLTLREGRGGGAGPPAPARGRAPPPPAPGPPAAPGRRAGRGGAGRGGAGSGGAGRCPGLRKCSWSTGGRCDPTRSR